MMQFLQFGVVGTFGFVIDTAVVYALRGIVGLYLAGIASYAVAVTFSWWANRRWTFERVVKTTPLPLEWARYVIANIPGLLLNRSAYFLLVSFSPLCAVHPVIAVAAGALAGMCANFNLARALVFR